MKKGDSRGCSHFPDAAEDDHEVDLRNISTFQSIVDASKPCSMRRSMMPVASSDPTPRGGEFRRDHHRRASPARGHARFLCQHPARVARDLAISGTLVLQSLVWLFVLPIRHITAKMVAFGHAPEDRTASWCLRRNDEIGVAETRARRMQRELPAPCNRRTGSRRSVSLFPRSITTCAISCRRPSSSPTARESLRPGGAPAGAEVACDARSRHRLLRTDSRLGRAQEPRAEAQPVDIAKLLDEVRDSLDLSDDPKIGWSPRGAGPHRDADPIMCCVS